MVEEDNLLTVEEHNLLSDAYKNVISSLRAAWRIILLIEQKEEGRRNEKYVAFSSSTYPRWRPSFPPFTPKS
ncbi:hypothetical protein TB1_031556 [Malus domestica]